MCWWLLLLVVALCGAARASGNSSQLAEVMVSSQAVRIRSGEPLPGERAEVRPVRSARRAASEGGEGSGGLPEARGGEQPGRPTEAERYPAEEGRGHMKKLSKMFKKIRPYLMVPGMMALGYAPFVLASLKMFVMNALTLNMMAFNAAIFITLRNMVFGPRRGEHIKYYNYGYKKKPHHHY